MSVENIKNPSVTEEALALQTDASGYIVSISGHQIAGGSGGGGTTYIGRNGVIVDSGYIELTQTAYNAVISVPGIATDVATLKNASATFALKTQLNDYYLKTETSSKSELETAFGNKQDNLTQEQLSAISSVSSKLTQDKADTLYAPISVTGDVDTLKSSSGDWNKVSAKLDTTAFSTVSGNFLTEHQSLDDYATVELLENVSGKLLTTEQYANDSATFLTAIPDTYALKTDIPTTVAQLTDSGNYYQNTETSSKTEISNALNTKVDKPTSIQTGKLVYDSDTSAWVSLPEGTTIIVQGQGSVSANYDSQNSTYTVSLLASAENALNAVDDKIDTTAVAQTYQTKEDMDDYLTKSEASSTYQPKGSYLVADDITGKLDKSIYANASGNWENTYNIVNQYSAAGKWLTINDIDEYAKLQDLNTVSSTLTGNDEYLSGQIDNKIDKADLDDYVPYSATELVIGSGNEVDYHYNNVKNNFVQGTNNIVSNNNSETFVQGKTNKLFTSQNSLVQGYGNSATNYYCLAQGALNDASTYSLTQGSNNTANSYSQAAGQNNSATTDSVAFGNANTAKDYSVAQGEANSAKDKTLAQGIANSGYYCSLVQGYHNYAYNYGLAQGYQNTAEYECFAQGYGNYAGKSGGSHALAQGYSNSAVYQSMAQGYMNTAWYDSFAQGFENSAFDNSMAQGLDNTAHKFGAAIGENNIAEEWSIALGQHNRAYNQSQAFGFRTIASSTVIDGHNYGMMAIGYCNNTSAGALFVAGNGYLDENSNIIRSDAFIIYPDGRVSAAGKISADGVELGAGGGGTSYKGRSGVNVDGGYIELTQTAYNAVTSVSSKVDIPDTTQSVLNNNYLIYSTLTGAGTTTGWMPLSANYYSKTEADGRYVATANVGTGLYYSGSSPKLGVKLGTDLAFDSNGFVQVNVGGTNIVDSSHCAFIVGVDHTASGQGAFAGGYGTHTSGVGNFIHGTYLNFNSGPNYDAVSNTPVFVGGTLNATTAQDYTDHGGYLQIIGNGIYRSGGQGDNSDAYILYRDGTVKAKDFIAGGDKLSANYPVPKSVPNTADNTLKVQRMFVVTGNDQIMSHLSLANGEGCIFFEIVGV